MVAGETGTRVRGTRYLSTIPHGGFIGFTCGYVYVDDLTLEAEVASAWVVQVKDDFSVSGSSGDTILNSEAAGRAENLLPTESGR